jgi:hypothetical protein
VRRKHEIDIIEHGDQAYQGNAKRLGVTIRKEEIH